MRTQKEVRAFRSAEVSFRCSDGHRTYKTNADIMLSSVVLCDECGEALFFNKERLYSSQFVPPVPSIDERISSRNSGTKAKR